MRIKDYLFLAFIILGISLSVWAKLTIPKTAYVRTADLVNGYLGMKEASNEFQKKSSGWQSDIDSLKRILQKEIDTYTQDSLTLSREKKKEKMKYINRLQNDLVEYTRTLSDKAGKEDEEMTQRVLNQVNSFIEQYGKEHGYTVILGTTSSGNIMYGDKSADITEPVLEALNNYYKK